VRIFSAVIAAVLLLVVSCKIESEDPFIRKVEAQRYTKDSLMRHDPNSPIPEDQKKHFISLAYFEPRPEYIVMAKYLPLDSPIAVEMEFSLEDNEVFYRTGKIEFELAGHKCSLATFHTKLQKTDSSISNILFVPFFDKTNGNETFQGGRYLYINYSGGDSLHVDFNAAVNPNCAYDPRKSCPMPPKENALPFRVEAGEKKW
jgi:uncharacterized protein